jgi:ketosteroid isomerase-like protein
VCRGKASNLDLADPHFGPDGLPLFRPLCDNLSPNWKQSILRRDQMRKRLLTIAMCVLALSISGLAAPKAKKKAAAPGAPDKVYLQKILTDWGAGDPEKMAHYYDQGDYNFFDIAPLKYNNWAEYQKGVTELLKGYKSLKLTLNDDAQIHTDGNLTWTTATVKEDAVTTAGKHELATLRWTLIFEKQAGKWMIVHEHMSEPLQ